MNLEDLYMSAQQGNIEDRDILIVSYTNKVRSLIDKLKIDGEAKETKLFNFIVQIMLLLNKNKNDSFNDFTKKLQVNYKLISKQDNSLKNNRYMLFDSYDSFEQRMNEITYINELLKQTKHLTRIQKEIIHLNIFKNYTLDEIAKIEGWSLNYIESNYHKAIRRMRNTDIEMKYIDKHKNI